MVASIFAGVAETRKKDSPGTDRASRLPDDTDVGDTDDKSLYDGEDETMPWIEEEALLDDEVGVLTVEEDSDDDDVEVPETQFGYEEWANDGSTEDADEPDEPDDTEDVSEIENDGGRAVDKLADEIRKKVQMKIEPLDKVACSKDYYKMELERLQLKNVVSLRKLKRDREQRSNEFLKKQLYDRLVQMEENQTLYASQSQRLQGNRYWRLYLSKH
jgi:hypothetical protein